MVASGSQKIDRALYLAHGGFMLIGKINDKTRQKILVTLKKIKGVEMIDLRVHAINDNGEFIETTAGLSLTLDQAKQAAELLLQGCEKLLSSHT
ncbi:MAG TPA: hypothetical protein DCR97_03035 [Deltaproteobacteria bacterium]|jgi:hypothetical protein|nr:hypothetical protein [Deltaproteobacteria bacterium]